MTDDDQRITTPVQGGSSDSTARTGCVSCGGVLAETDALTCSPDCAEKWRAWVLAAPAGCERSGECALPFRHDGTCDWGE